MSLVHKRCNWMWLSMATCTCWAFVLRLQDLRVVPCYEFCLVGIRTVVCCLLWAWVVLKPSCGSGVSFQETNHIILRVCVYIADEAVVLQPVLGWLTKRGFTLLLSTLQKEQFLLWTRNTYSSLLSILLWCQYSCGVWLVQLAQACLFVLKFQVLVHM